MIKKLIATVLLTHTISTVHASSIPLCPDSSTLKNKTVQGVILNHYVRWEGFLAPDYYNTDHLWEGKIVSVKAQSEAAARVALNQELAQLSISKSKEALEGSEHQWDCFYDTTGSSPSVIVLYTD